MKKLLLFLLCMPLIGLGQDLENTISGSYSFGISPDSGRTGHLDIYMETDSSFIFCFNLFIINYLTFYIMYLFFFNIHYLQFNLKNLY